MAYSRNSKQIAFTACDAYGAINFEAQDGSHEYEAIPLGNFSPVQASNPTPLMQKSGPYENVPARSAEDQGTAKQTTLPSSGKTLDDDEHHYEITCVPSSIATPTKTTAMPTVTMPTTTSPQDTQYEEVGHDMQM